MPAVRLILKTMDLCHDLIKLCSGGLGSCPRTGLTDNTDMVPTAFLQQMNRKKGSVVKKDNGRRDVLFPNVT